MTTTNRIFTLIEENRLTAKEFSVMCKLSQGNITDWKTGRSKPSIDALKKISSAFNVNIDWLLGESIKKEKENFDKIIVFPKDFKYYIEDLPDCVVYRIKFITNILLISNFDFNFINIEKEIDVNLSVYAIPLRFRKDAKKAIIYLYNYNIQLIINKNQYSFDTTKLNSNSISSQYYNCPVYGQISAGQPNWTEECLEGYLPIDPNLMNIVDPEECFFLRVNGESMNKLIRNGAYALIRKQDIVENGEIAVVLVNGFDATLKKFTRQNDLIILEPMSNDPNFTTQVYAKDTEIKILGKYIGKFEMNS